MCASLTDVIFVTESRSLYDASEPVKFTGWGKDLGKDGKLPNISSL